MANNGLTLTVHFAWWVKPALYALAYAMVPVAVIMPEAWSRAIVDRAVVFIGDRGMRVGVE